MRQEAARYPSLSVHYVDHHNPDLLLFDNAGDEMSRIDLTRLKTTANVHRRPYRLDQLEPLTLTLALALTLALTQVHKLLSLLGVREVCHDDNVDCPNWASSGQCDVNPAYMCANARHPLSLTETRCATLTLALGNRYASCRKSCGKCAADPAASDEPS